MDWSLLMGIVLGAITMLVGVGFGNAISERKPKE